MAKTLFIFVIMISASLIFLANGRAIGGKQRFRSARWSRSPLMAWSSMFSPVPSATMRAQNQKAEMARRRSAAAVQTGADKAKWMAKVAQSYDDGNEDEEPLVYSSYNRDCFFTPVNCFVGRAGQQASKIIGTAFNSKRQILFIRRTPK